LQKRFKNPLTKEELIKLGTTLGADVPFFFYGKSAFCEGIGEKVSRCTSLAGMPMVIVKPDIGVSTPVCFRMCDESPAVFDEDEYKKALKEALDNDGEAVDRVKAVKDILTNDMQGPACEIVPQVAEVLAQTEKTSPVYTAMSGSGSAVFAIYNDVKERDEALKELTEVYKDTNFLVALCETL
jgi:4-diphosphocytidyl-2-C-methyl-D-erythritol kinase